MIVVDASAVLELLLVTPTGLQVAARVLDGVETLHAPELNDLEIAQVLRRYERSGDLSAERAEGALDDLADLRMERYPHAPLLSRIWELRPNFTAYDAAYVALAEALPATLLTCDTRLARASQVAAIEVLGDPEVQPVPL